MALVSTQLMKSDGNSSLIATDIAIKLSSPELHTAILNKSVFWKVGSLILEFAFKWTFGKAKQVKVNCKIILTIFETTNISRVIIP